MKIIANERVIFFDVDDTLAMWDKDYRSPGEGKIPMADPYVNEVAYLTPHQKHIDLLRKHKGRGYTVIVWSQGGYAWAHAVIRALDLTAYVDMVMTKPAKYVDDLPCVEWMGSHLYFKDL